MTREYNIELNRTYEITTGGYKIYYPVKVIELGLIGIKIISTLDNKIINIPYRMIKRIYDYATGANVYDVLEQTRHKIVKKERDPSWEQILPNS